MQHRQRIHVAAGVVALLGALGLSGCAMTTATLPDAGSTGTTPIGNLQGKVMGGQSPVYQAHIYLMAANTTGYNRPSISLLAAGNTTADTTVMGTPTNPAYYVTSDASGNWNITGDYTCTYNTTTPSQSQQLYMLSLSGNSTFMPGPTGGVTNPLIGLMAVLGSCPSNGTFAGHLNYIIMNEVSTIAAAYALAGFANNSYTVSSGSSAQAQLGLYNAFANANQIYDIQNIGNGSTHEARTVTPNGNGTVPRALVDSLANTIAACVNSNATPTAPEAPTLGNCYTLNSYIGNPGAGYQVTNAPGGYTVATEGEVNNGTTGFTFTYTTAGATTLYAGQWVNVTGNTSASYGYNNYGLVLASGLTATSFSIFVPYGQNAYLANSTPTLAPAAATGVTAIVGNDTASDAIYIAQHPANQVTNLYNLGGTSVQFADDLGGAPNDFSLGIAYASGGATAFSEPTGICIDKSGNAYISTQGNTTSIFKLSPLGVPISPFPVGTGTGYNCSIDTAGNVWAPNIAGSTIMEYTSAGVAVSGSPYTAGGALNQPSNSANDATGSYTYIANNNGTPPFLSSPNGNMVRIAGSVNAPTVATYTSSTLSTNNYPMPSFIAVDQAGDFWVTFNGNSKVGRYSSTGTQAFQIPVGSLSNVASVAVDSNSDGWVSFIGGNALAKITTSGTATQYTGGGLNQPRVVAIDGVNNVFVANQGSSVSEFNSAGTAISGTSGYTAGGQISLGVGLAVDPSGDVWETSYINNTVIEFIGLGTPVVTPLSSFIGVAANTTGNRP